MEQEYNENQIQILEGLEAVRKRPGMYIGSTSSKGLHHLVYEIVDNSVDEALAGHCSLIEVFINEDNSITVIDDGRGIPIGIHPQKNIPAVEVVFTILHAGGKFGGGGYKVSGGLHGVGASVVNALSESLIVNIFSDGKIYEQKYSKGDVVTKLVEIDTCQKDKSGTKVTFKPDVGIFDEIEYSYDILRQKLMETAFLTKGVKIIITDLREEEKSETFCYEGGIKEFVEYINKNKTPIYDEIFYCESKKDAILVEISFQHNEGYIENNYSYVNNINTTDGGTHVVGFKTGLTRTINDYCKKFNMLKDSEKITGDDFREGLTTVISIKLEDPQFEGQTKGKLGNKDAKGAVESVLYEYLTYFLEENPAIARIMIEKALLASRARSAAKKARELVRRKNILEVSRLPGKLTDCTDKNPENCEIYIVEGNSAGGSAVGARNPKKQAILPLKGKILNVEKSRLDKILGNEEIRTMITAFGTGIYDEFDIEKLRYHKIVLMTDADVDGAHISTLLLTFIFRFMRPLIDSGYVYLAKPPLFKIEKGKKVYYAYSNEERDEIIEEIGEENIKDIQRYKGLGEMDAEQLWETTMNPENRTLLRVTIEDAILADETFDKLMGDKVEPRREFIEQNAKFVTNLDI